VILGRKPTKAPWWLFVLAVVAAWLLGAELAIFTAFGKDVPARLPGLAVWTLVALSAAFLAVAGRRELTSERQTARLIASLKDALGSFGMLTETSLVALPLDNLLQQLLGRLCQVLDCDVAAILVGGDGVLTFQASYGLDVGPLETVVVPPGEGIIGSVLASRVPQAVGDSGRLDLLASQLRHGLLSAAGGPIMVEDRLLGVCVVGSSAPSRFDDRRLQLLQLVADRAGAEIERARLSAAQARSRAEAERARRHGVMLAQASEVLLRATDDSEENLQALADVVVVDFAEWCSVDLTDLGGGPQTVVRRRREGVDVASSPVSQATSLTYDPGVSRQRQVAEITAGAPDPAADYWLSADRWLSAGHRTIGVAITIGDSVFGTLTVGRAVTQPAFEPSEVVATVELGARVAVAVERALRYRGARDEARASQRRAAQLHQLVRASIEVQQLREEPEILAKIADRARQVFDAQSAVVTVELDNAGPLQAVAQRTHETVLGRPAEQPAVVDLPAEASAGRVPWRAGEWFGAPVVAHEGSAGGGVAIRSADANTPDDEVVLVLLAQMASAALDNALLTHTIQASEGRWRVLVEAAPIGIVEVDLSGRVLWWNTAARALFDWPSAPPRSATDRAPLFPEQEGEGPRFAAEVASRLGTMWTEVLRGAEVIDRGLTTTSAEGDRRELAVSAAPLLSTTGAISGILTLLADVTDRRRLEDQLRRAQRMEAIGQLAGGVAHDFNNLLTLITGYTELLKRRVNDDQRGVELAEGIRTAAIRASLLTGQLLTISKSQSAHRVVLAPADALSAAGEVLERILGGDIALHWALDADAGRVSVDPGQLEQVILNLATNARDAMPGGGRVDIGVSSVSLDQTGSDELGVPTGRYVRISVTDTGTGMDAETRHRCFEPFFSTKGPTHGTGLGLAAVKGVVGDSGGAVSVESAPGRGATFRVYLPALAEMAPQMAAAPADGSEVVTADGSEAAPAGQRTVLVADDDGVLLRLMSQSLSRDGYRVLEASGGGEALSVAADWPGPIDALISDVVMPGMTGPDVAANLQMTRPAMRVLFVSGGMGGAVAAGMPLDPQSFLAKPFKPSQLIARMREVLSDPAA
jgi:signal transduction histidine kinase/transcriptional regulator with GAF, ATPase, and Fis domain/ActR/RegA family two-component response regulator